MRPMNFNAAMEKLLMESNLPCDDLVGSNKVTFFGQEHKGQLIGLVGLEFYRSNALLRSLVVRQSASGSGLATNLVSYAEQQADISGVKDIYLLTTTADGFFERLGYSVVSRVKAPKTITSTVQFSSLCPASAVFMTKHL